MTTATNISAQCPFFEYAEKLHVNCEGGCVIEFPDEEAANDFTKRFCSDVNNWERCSIAANKNRFYARKFGEVIE